MPESLGTITEGKPTNDQIYFDIPEKNKRYIELSNKCAALNGKLNEFVREMESVPGVSVVLIKGSRDINNKYSLNIWVDGSKF